MTTARFIKKSYGSFEFNEESISSMDLQEIPKDLNQFQIHCDKFQFTSDLQTQFRGKNLTINTKELQIEQSCTVNLSGTTKDQYTTDAGTDILGNGRDGKDGCPGENGGSFTLKYKTITSLNDAILTIISNGADGMNGQKGGNGMNGTNGRDATECSFIIKKCDFKLYSPMCAESHEMYEKFGLKAWQGNTSQSVITTEDGLTAFVYVQTSPDEDWGLMLVKGSDGEPGKRGGRGGIGGQGGLPGKISILSEQSDWTGIINMISNPGKDGSNGLDGSNGINGKCGRDLWKYDLRSWEYPETFGEDKPRKFKLVWGEGPYSVCDVIRNDYVRVEEVCDEDVVPDLVPDNDESLNTSEEVEDDFGIEDDEGVEDEEEKNDLIVGNRMLGFIHTVIVQPIIGMFLNFIAWPKRFF